MRCFLLRRYAIFFAHSRQESDDDDSLLSDNNSLGHGRRGDATIAESLADGFTAGLFLLVTVIETQSSAKKSWRSFAFVHFIVLGISFYGRVFSVSYLENEETIRIISARQSTRSEKRVYESFI